MVCADGQFNVFPNHKFPTAYLRSAARFKLISFHLDSSALETINEPHSNIMKEGAGAQKN